MNQSKIEKTIALYKKLSNVSWHGDEVTGAVSFNKGINELIKYLDANSLIYSTFSIDGKSNPLSSLSLLRNDNQTIELTLQPPRNPVCDMFFAKDLDDLLRCARYKLNEPKLYYIADKDFYNIENKHCESIEEYRNTIILIKIIKDIAADHFENNSEIAKAIILCKSKIIIPIKYQVSDLILLDGIDELLTELSIAPQLNHKIEIFKNTLCETLINIPMEERFLYITKHFEDIRQRYEDNFNLFMSDFSFDKIKQEVEERKIEYVNKLNDIVSDIQNKILGIPISLLLVSTQISSSNDFIGDFLKNSGILVSSYGFLLLMFFILTNQLNMLEVIKKSAEYNKALLKEKYSLLNDKLEESFGIVFERYKQQKKMLDYIWYMALLSCLLSLFIFAFKMKKFLI